MNQRGPQVSLNSDKSPLLGLAVCLVLMAVLLCEQLLAGTILPLSQSNLDVQKKSIGTTEEGNKVVSYTLTNANGMSLEIMSFGATITSVRVPDRDGEIANVTLHLDTLEDYLKGHPLFGSTVGRFANRIAGARFILDGVEYALTPNSRGNHIHGGKVGFQRQVWNSSSYSRIDEVGVEFSISSPDGDEGYPGKVDVKVTFQLNNRNELTLLYEAVTSKKTHVNLTNHAYWNLAGAGSGDVLGHVMQLFADHYLPVDDKKIPIGNLVDVKNTPMGFLEPMSIGSRIDQVEDNNYDHCYVVNRVDIGEVALAARVTEPASGRTMEVWTTHPGVQFYTAKALSSRYQAGGRLYGPYHGFCLETQHFPNSPNEPGFPSTILRPGESYSHKTVFKFSVDK